MGDYDDTLIPFIFDISLKLMNKKLLNYCIHKYYNILKEKINTKINIMIYKFNNIEDILFYLYLNHNIQFTTRILINCIKKHYNHIFKYSFNNIENKDIHILFKTSIQENNYEIFNYLLSYHNYKIKNEEFTKILILNLDIYKENTKEFIYNLLNNYKQKIVKDCSLIEKCIQCNIHSNTIKRLIYEGYQYSYYEIKLALEKKDLQLLRDLSNNFNEDQ